MKNFAFGAFLLMITSCLAESFIIQEKSKKRTNVNHLKQEIAQSMGTLIESSATSIELEAKIQQRVGKELRALIDGEGRLQKEASGKLEKMLAELRQEIHRRKQFKVTQEELLKAL